MLEKRQKNEPVRERDRTAEGEAETRRGGQKDEVTSSESSFWHENPSSFLPSTANKVEHILLPASFIVATSISP